MSELSLGSLLAGLAAYIVAFLVGVIPLGYFALYRLRIAATKHDEEMALREGNRAVAIQLGSTVLCQAILARHTVFAIMAISRSIVVEDLATGDIVGVLLRSLLILVILSSLSILSVWFAEYIFSKLTKNLEEQKAIRDGNVAMAIFFGLVLLAITIILSDGMEDFSRSLIPYARSGVALWS